MFEELEKAVIAAVIATPVSAIIQILLIGLVKSMRSVFHVPFMWLLKDKVQLRDEVTKSVAKAMLEWSKRRSEHDRSRTSVEFKEPPPHTHTPYYSFLPTPPKIEQYICADCTAQGYNREPQTIGHTTFPRCSDCGDIVEWELTENVVPVQFRSPVKESEEAN